MSSYEDTNSTLMELGFASSSKKVRVAIETERLAYAYTIHPAFATETSCIDPLPHQRIAVYDYMLKQNPLRFLLADDAGAGKTIMCGLYIREMLFRKRIQRVLIVPPAGLVGNWHDELLRLFQIHTVIATGFSLREENVFKKNDIVICSIDTIRNSQNIDILAQAPAFDLVVFDEAHKLTCDRGKDMRERPSERYKFAATICGLERRTHRKKLLPWYANHVLLLTATPHQGKDFPYFALWRLLEPELFPTQEAFAVMMTPEIHDSHFIRRTKEEMVNMDGEPLYPMRCSSTLGYKLSAGEQKLYDDTTDYLISMYNKAEILKNKASQLAMGVFQRRLASSTYALLCSLKRRLQKLEYIIGKAESMGYEDNLTCSTETLGCLFCTPTDDIEGKEPDEDDENKALSIIFANSLDDLYSEKFYIKNLIEDAEAVYRSWKESKFEKLYNVLQEYKNEKILIFTEHKDTLQFLLQRLEGVGYIEKIAYIHGGLDYEQRQQQISLFRKDDGAHIMLCTDAAAEGVNLQFCWIMINYDIPWNPARLEQRMGRIHRYGQKHDPVLLINLVASETREGKVLTTLLEKLETIRRSLQSDKVFDSIGRVFNELAITDWMHRAMMAAQNGESMDIVGKELNGILTQEQVQAITASNQNIYGKGGNIKATLPRLRDQLENEHFCRMLPGYTQAWLEDLAPLLQIKIEGKINECFHLQKMGDKPIYNQTELWDALFAESNGLENPWLCLQREMKREGYIWIHPGEAVFNSLRAMAQARLGQDALAGAIFFDTETEYPYLLQVSRIRVIRTSPDKKETLEERLVCVCYDEQQKARFCPVERFLMIEDSQPEQILHTPESLTLAANVNQIQQEITLLLTQKLEEIVKAYQDKQKAFLPHQQHQRHQAQRLQSSALFKQFKHIKQQTKSTSSSELIKEMERIKREYDEVKERLSLPENNLEEISEQITFDPIETIGSALVLPIVKIALEEKELSSSEIEEIAMQEAIAWEGRFGRVIDVHTPKKAKLAGLLEYPGYDLLSFRSLLEERRCIEVKGIRGKGNISMSRNEWAQAVTLGKEYWLYVVYDCATDQPHLVRVQDPFGKLLATESIVKRWSFTLKQVLEMEE